MIRIGDSVVMAFDARPGRPDTPAILRLYVESGDDVHRRALEARAASVTEMTEHFFGDRSGRVRDPLGNFWWIQTHVEDVDPEEMGRRAGEDKYVEAMRYAQESLDRELGGRDGGRSAFGRRPAARRSGNRACCSESGRVFGGA